MGSCSTVIPSTPALPLFPRTRRSARFRFSRSHTSSISSAADAGRSDTWVVVRASVPSGAAPRASPVLSAAKARLNWLFCRLARMRCTSYFPLLTVRAFGPTPTMPSADFCAAVSASPDALSPAVETRRRPPAISSTAVRTRPPNLRSASLMDLGFAVFCPLARRSPLVFGSCPSARAFAPRFLQTPRRRDALAVRYPSPPSGWGRTFTSKLSNMRGVQKKGPVRLSEPALVVLLTSNS